MSLPQTYAEITRAVAEIVAKHSGNDVERACYMVARAAFLRIRADKGSRVAAEKAYQLGDEFSVLDR